MTVRSVIILVVFTTIARFVATAAGAAAEESILLRYSFDEGQGNLIDGRGMDPANSDGTCYGAQYVAMTKGFALAFDGATSFAKLAGSTSLMMGFDDFSVEMWLKLDSDMPGAIVGKKGPDAAAAGWIIEYLKPTKELAFEIGDGSAHDGIRTPLADTVWHHIAAVRHSKTLTLYVDGKSAAAATRDLFGANVNNETVFLLFGMGSSRASFHGKLDDVVIHKHGLSAEEIAAQFELRKDEMKNQTAAKPATTAPAAPAPGAKASAPDAPHQYREALALHYRFDEDPHDTAKDLGSYGNDGKIVNAKYIDEVDGRRGVLRFDGKSSYIDCGKAASLQIAGDMSFEMWVRLNRPFDNDHGFIFGEGEESSESYQFGYFQNLTLGLWYRGGLGDSTFAESTWTTVDRNILSEKWSHIAVVVESPRCRFYHNGKQVADVYMPIPGVTQVMERTKRIAGGRPGFAPIDLTEFRLYRKALSAEEVAAHAAGKEAPSAPSIELAVEPNWYTDTLALRVSAGGEDFSGHQAELILQRADGHPVAAQKFPLTEAFAGAGRFVATSNIKLSANQGKVRAVARVLDDQGKAVKTVSRDVTLEKPAWIHSPAGRSDQVLSPWTAVKAEAKDATAEVSVWGRRYVFGPTPFFQKVESAGESMLSAPMTFTAQVDGKAVEWKNDQTRLLGSTRTAASIEQTREDGAVALRVNSTTEYDGYTIFDCELQARNDVSIENITLDIPLQSKFATLCYGDRALPPNDEIEMLEWYRGAVKGDLGFRFSPTVWLGNEERGLCWQSESDQDWNYADPRKAIEILPRGATTTFRAHLIDRLTKLEAGKSLRYKFALIATPVKPMLRDAWSLRIARSEPYGADLELPDRKVGGKPELQHIVETGVRALFINVNDRWPYPMPGNERYATALRRLNDAAHSAGLKIYPYLFHLRFPTVVPEFDTYGLNMALRPLQQYIQPAELAHSRRPGPISIDYGANSQSTVFVCPKSAALQDACIHSFAERVKTFGDDGIYLDGTAQVVPCQNLDHGCGYRSADGAIHKTYPVFAVREFMRRIYTIVKQHDPNGIVDVHCSFGFNPAAQAYCDVTWNGEQWYHLRKTGTKYIAGELPLDMFRTEFMGRQFGVPSEMLTYRLGSPMKCAATSLLHDVSPRYSTNEYDNYSQSALPKDNYYALIPQLWKLRDQFGAEQAEKLFYWNNQAYVTVSPEQCYATLLKHPTNGVLALISNLSRDGQTVTARFHLDKIGLAGKQLVVANALTGQPAAMSEDGTLAIRLESEQWVYLWLKPTPVEPK